MGRNFWREFQKNKHASNFWRKFSKKINMEHQILKEKNPRKKLALLTWAWQFSVAGEPNFCTLINFKKNKPGFFRILKKINSIFFGFEKINKHGCQKIQESVRISKKINTLKLLSGSAKKINTETGEFGFRVKGGVLILSAR